MLILPIGFAPKETMHYKKKLTFICPGIREIIANCNCTFLQSTELAQHRSWFWQQNGLFCSYRDVLISLPALFTPSHYQKQPYAHIKSFFFKWIKCPKSHCASIRRAKARVIMIMCIEEGSFPSGFIYSYNTLIYTMSVERFS